MNKTMIGWARLGDSGGREVEFSSVRGEKATRYDRVGLDTINEIGC